MAQIALEDSQSVSTMTRGPSVEPESELNTPNDEYPTYPLRVRTANDTNTPFTSDKMKTRTEATLVASHTTPPRATPLVRKRTTKELISLYESGPNTNTSYSNGNGVPKAKALPAYSAPVRSSKLNLNAPLPELPQSKPLRESFKDLLVVFGKKRVTKQKHVNSRRVSPSVERPQPKANHPARGEVAKTMMESVGPAPTPNDKPASPSVSPLYRQFTGSTLMAVI